LLLLTVAEMEGLAPTGEVNPLQKYVFPAELSFFGFFSADLVRVPFAIPVEAAMATLAKFA
jgi:hypothetical protein